MIRFYIFASEQIRERIVWFIKHFGQQTEIKICKEKNNGHIKLLSDCFRVKVLATPIDRFYWLAY